VHQDLLVAGCRAGGIASHTREVGAKKRDRRRHVGQHAQRPANRWLVRLVARSGKRAIGTGQQRLDRVHAAANDGGDRLGQAQARPSGD
jgi:hypothetical protein